jgi:hypothetical protein
MDIKDFYSISSPETPHEIREAKKISRLSATICYPNLDFDDESIREEVERLSVHQKNLQKELQAVINVVNIVQYADDSEELENFRSLSFKSLTDSSRNSLQPTSSGEDNEISEISMVDEPIPVPVPARMRRRRSFSGAYFHFAKPKNMEEKLEEQKQRQKEIIKDDLAVNHPGLEDILEIHHEMQGEIVQDAVEKSDLPRVEEILEKKKVTLEEEKKKQMEMLEGKLREIDPALMDAMHSQTNEQAGLIAEKRAEILNASKRGKLTQTKLTKNFWNGAIRRLGSIVEERRHRGESESADAEDSESADAEKEKE